ncbi:MAG: molybdopterin-dependent oxidoreductase [Deltaproteobacteria bacterium]|nr:molybdopterin-dependent oxidoreductase [Deltaproteobacteria bacterium]
MNNEVRRSICHWCHNKCMVELHLENGELKEQTWDRAHPNAPQLRRQVQGCTKARHAAEWYYHPGRTKFPLKRVGEKGEGKWQQLTWDQVLDEIAEKLTALKEKCGPETLATSAGTGRTDDCYRARFFNVFGSPNHIGASNICYGPHRMVGEMVLGWSPARFGGTLDTKCMVFVGNNAEQAIRKLWFAVLDIQKAGSKLIVIDPRRTVPAEKADLWLQLRPGTDAALMLAMIHVILEEDLYDKAFVAKWCHGFEELKAGAREYPPEKVEEITWVPAEKIRAAARMYATSKPAGILPAMGIEHLNNSIEALHCTQILSALTGNVDLLGGDVATGCHDQFMGDYEMNLNELVPPEQKAKQIGSDRYRFNAFPGFDLIMEHAKKKLGRDHTCYAHAPSVYRAMLTGNPYPVRAMITVSSNPMVTAANTKLVYKAIKSLDLYIVSEIWMTPSAELADYVLPAAIWSERPLVFNYWDTAGFLEFALPAMPAKVEGKWDRRPDYDLWRGLAVRLGLGQYFPWETLEEAYDHRLEAFGKTLRQLVEETPAIYPPHQPKKYEAVGFGTPTGKFEMYSTVLEKLGYDPLPQYREPPESPKNEELAKEYPLILITGGRHLPFFHSEHRQIDSVRKQRPHPLVQVHPKTAAELGIADGDWIWIETLRGRVRQKCVLFDGIDPRVVHGEHGWWFPELPGEEPWLHGVWESNINVVVDDDPDHCNPINGGWPARTAMCRIYPVKTYGTSGWSG